MRPHLAARAASATSSAIRDLLRLTEQPGILSLAGGLPIADGFPVAELRAAADRVLDAGGTYGPAALQYGRTEGVTELRELLAARVGVSPSRVVVTTGSQQALDLIARCVVDPGDAVVVEAPSYVGALQAVRTYGPRIVGVPGDRHGFDVDELEARLASGLRPAAVYVVTNFANPSGATLSEARRARLVELAAAHGFLVIEDDPYGELRFRGTAPSPMISLPGAEEHVAAVRTVSKTLAPGLRVGWAVLPEWLVDHVVVAKQGADLHTSTLTQHLALALLADETAHAARIEASTRRYAANAEALVAAVQHHLGDVLQLGPVDGGMFAWGAFTDERLDTTRLLAAALDEGVAFVPGAAFYDGMTDTEVPVNRIRLSFATLAPGQFDEAIRRLAAACRVSA